MGMILEEILLGFHLPLAVLAKTWLALLEHSGGKLGGTS